MDRGVGGYGRKSTLTGEVCTCGTGVRCSTRECEWEGEGGCVWRMNECRCVCRHRVLILTVHVCIPRDERDGVSVVS